jgi:hypothetical protein
MLYVAANITASTSGATTAVKGAVEFHLKPLAEFQNYLAGYKLKEAWAIKEDDSKDTLKDLFKEEKIACRVRPHFNMYYLDTDGSFRHIMIGSFLRRNLNER